MSVRILTFRSYHAAATHRNPKLQSPSFELRSVISVRRKLKIAKIERFSTPFGKRQSAATSRHTHSRHPKMCARKLKVFIDTGVNDVDATDVAWLHK